MSFLAHSTSYKILPKNLLDGFNDVEQKNWLALFDDAQMFADVSLASNGFGNLHGREFHANRMAIIAYAKALDKVYVHDLGNYYL